ncbi:hypothetical protein IWX47DRAFT_675762, partial [Phyllosticta citricarpa]
LSPSKHPTLVPPLPSTASTGTTLRQLFARNIIISRTSLRRHPQTCRSVKPAAWSFPSCRARRQSALCNIHSFYDTLHHTRDYATLWPWIALTDFCMCPECNCIFFPCSNETRAPRDLGSRQNLNESQLGLIRAGQRKAIVRLPDAITFSCVHVWPSPLPIPRTRKPNSNGSPARRILSWADNEGEAADGALTDKAQSHNNALSIFGRRKTSSLAMSRRLRGRRTMLAANNKRMHIDFDAPTKDVTASDEDDAFTGFAIDIDPTEPIKPT